jgi:spermidine synthase
MRKDMIIEQNITENGEIILRHGSAGYEIIVDGQFLMSSASGDSSAALVELGLAELNGRNNLQVLIAGLGLGFSLKAALANAVVEEVVVVELEAQIIDWHCRNLISGTSHLLNDPRSRVFQQDFLQYSKECRTKFDLIALDIDNGPDWLSHETNSPLYSKSYLQRLAAMLNMKSILTIWSAAVAPQLKQSLAGIFRNIVEVEVADRNGEGKPIPAYIYICKSTE